MKICSGCDVEKEIACFGRDKNKNDGLRIYCKECVKSQNRINYVKDIDSNRSRALIRRNSNLDLSRENTRKWKANNPDKVKASLRKQSEKDRRDPVRYLLSKKRKRRGKVLKSKEVDFGIPTVEALGCSPDEWRDFLKERLPVHSKLMIKATWEDVMAKNRIHIDEIIPVSAWNHDDPVHQVLCWHFSNSQLLWRYDNIRKGGYSLNPQKYDRMVAEAVAAYHSRGGFPPDPIKGIP